MKAPNPVLSSGNYFVSSTMNSLLEFRSRKAPKDTRKQFAASKDELADILHHLTTLSGVSETRTVSYLNAFVKLLKNEQEIEKLGFTVEDILYCLRPLCFLESTKLRNAAFRAVRHLIRSESHLDVYHKLKFDFLVAREVTGGGIQLCRKILIIAPHKMSNAPVRAIVSFVHPNQNDQLQIPALAFLAELALLNSDVFIACGGVSALIRNIPCLKSDSIIEALIGALLYLTNRPETRVKAAVNLRCLTGSVYMDRALNSKDMHSVDSSVRWATMPMICLLKSWTGILHLCQGNMSAVATIVNSLYLSHLQKPILEALFKLFNLKQPEWTDEINVALDAVDPSRWQDGFRITEGFVAAEVQALFPHLAKSRVNLLQVHRALVLQVFLNANLMEAIVHVIVSKDTLLSVYATVLLGELLNLVHTILPPEVLNAVAPGLPDLLSYAVKGQSANGGNYGYIYDDQFACRSWQELFDRGMQNDNPIMAGDQGPGKEAQDRALRAAFAIARLRTKPISLSLYLRHLVSWIKSPLSGDSSAFKTPPVSKLFALNSCEEGIKESGVLMEKDPFKWNWEVIRAVLKKHEENLRKTTDSNKKLFVHRICEFITPAFGQYGRTELSSDRKFSSRMTLAGLDLISVLIKSPEESEFGILLNDFLLAVAFQLNDLKQAHSAHDSHLSPTNIAHSLCQDYFLIIGYLSTTEKGQKALQATKIYEQLMLLIMNTNQDCYVKLILSTLDFSKDKSSRDILRKVFESKTVSCRMYATKAIHSMLRIGVGHNKSLTTFLVGLIVDQLSDDDRNVASVALKALQEASYCKEYIDAIVDQHPCLMRHGDNGLLVLVRCLSTVEGFQRLNQANFVNSQLEKWGKNYNYRYVNLVESLLTSENEDNKEVFLPPHLYQQLACHKQGLQMILGDSYVQRLVEAIHLGKCSTDTEILELKAALYAISGVAAVMDSTVISSMIHIATVSQVHSVQAVAVMALCNVSTSVDGVHKLKSFDWFSVKHNRHERWPTVIPQNDADDIIPMDCDSNSVENDKSPLFNLPEEEEEGEESFWAVPGGSTQRVRDQRSATLPHSSGGLSFYHNRSYSDSKAEQSDATDYVGEQVAQLRYEGGRKSRSNSYTDSSTSGESTYGARLYTGSDRFHTLSPIPSSSSIGTCHISIRRNNSLTLTHKTVEALRDSRRIVLKELEQTNSFPFDFLLKSGRKNSSNESISTREPWDDSKIIEEPDFSIIDTDDGLNQLNDTLQGEEGVPIPQYMGICLPMDIQCLFPKEEKQLVNKHVWFVSNKHKNQGLDELKNSNFHCENCFLGPKNVHNTITISSECESDIQSNGLWDVEKDILANDSVDSSTTEVASFIEPPHFLTRGRTTIRNELHRMVEQMSNPILHKTCKTSLLQIKQTHEDLFSDVCVYSDVCYILSTCHIRVDSRNFVHELFDSPFPEIWDDAAAYLNGLIKSSTTPNGVAS